MLASTPYLGHQLTDQRLARALSDEGYRVVYVEPAAPVGVQREWHREAARARRDVVPDKVDLVIPWRLPLGRRPSFEPFTAVLVGLQLRWKLRAILPSGHLALHTGLIITAGHPWVARLLPRIPSVLIVKDDYAASTELTGLSPRRTRRRRRASLRLIDTVTAVSPSLADTLLREGVSATVVPAGCEEIPFDAVEPALLAKVNRPRAVFSGMLSNRIDFTLLRDTVDAGFTLVLAGRRQFRFSDQAAYDELLATGNVVELGELDQETLGRVMTHCDIGLVPYTLSDFNRGSFPLKTFEYLAAGLPVVASPLPALLWVDDPHIYVIPSGAQTKTALATALEASTDVQIRAACRAAAAANSWAVRANTYLGLLSAQQASR